MEEVIKTIKMIPKINCGTRHGDAAASCATTGTGEATTTAVAVGVGGATVEVGEGVIVDSVLLAAGAAA